MQLFQDFLDRSKQLNQTPAATAKRKRPLNPMPIF